MKDMDFVRNVLALVFGGAYVYGFILGLIPPGAFELAAAGVIGYVFYVKGRNQPAK